MIIDNKNHIVISVIVPIYKVEKYLRKCVQSLLNQTYDNIDIILVDDGSPDLCGEICDEFAAIDSRIVVIHKENGGLSSARNAGIDIATGDYIMFVDSDDYVEPDFCEKALNMILNNNVDICSFGYYQVDESHKTVKQSYASRIISAEEAISHIIKKDDIIFNFAWNKIYSRSLFEGIRYPIGRLFEDSAVTYLLFHKAKSIYVSKDVLYNYLQRPESIMSDYNSPQCNIDRFEIWLDRFHFIFDHYPNLRNPAIMQLTHQALNGVFYLPRKQEYRIHKNKYMIFLYTNKSEILTSNYSNIKIILFYYCHPLFWIFMSLKEIRRRVKKQQTI